MQDAKGKVECALTGNAIAGAAAAWHYDAEAQHVWREVLRRNAELIRNHGARLHPAYLEGIRRLALPTHIPSVDELNERLEPTQWRIVPVDGYMPSGDYARLVAASIFPVSRVIRRLEHIDFAPAPDLVHDILGHLPMLFSPRFRGYLRRLARVMATARPSALDQEFHDAVSRAAALKAVPSSVATEVAAAEARVARLNLELSCGASETTVLRRLYVWSIEFGLLRGPTEFRIHGAALLSAPAELGALCSGNSAIMQFTNAILEYENAFSEAQAQYFVAGDLADYQGVLTEYEASMQSQRSRALKREVCGRVAPGVGMLERIQERELMDAERNAREYAAPSEPTRQGPRA
jgi:phenylalanine-4-hydroxylase